MSLAGHLLAVYADTLLTGQRPTAAAVSAKGEVGDGLQSEPWVAEFETQRPGSTYGIYAAMEPAMNGSTLHDKACGPE
jgi:hypothetical protein